jgi:dolichol kinase
VIVEGALWYRDEVHAVTWLVTFLLSPEGSSSSTSSTQYPRAVWLIYWLVVVTVALHQAPQQCSVVISRKWFHLVAIALFLPVTLAAPQLMSLSYAIALCILIVVESMRSYLPTIVQEYYGRYLNPLKEHKDKVVISHISLILGCAMPLWIHECTSRPTLFFGILVLGVGDSLAAVVGIQFGRRKWPSCRKTVEGSVAMWMGMALCCCCFPLQNWVAAVTFTTLLEAFTTQIDNLILPLAGVTVLLLQSLE